MECFYGGNSVSHDANVASLPKSAASVLENITKEEESELY